MEETPGRASQEKLGCRTPPQLHAGGVGRQQQQPTSCLVQPIGTHGGDVMYFGEFMILMRVLLFMLDVSMLRVRE